MWQCGHYGYCSSCGWQNNTYPRPSYPRSSDIFVTGGCDQQEPTHPRVSIYCKQIDSLVKYIYIHIFLCLFQNGLWPNDRQKNPHVLIHMIRSTSQGTFSMDFGGTPFRDHPWKCSPDPVLHPGSWTVSPGRRCAMLREVGPVVKTLRLRVAGTSW